MGLIHGSLGTTFSVCNADVLWHTVPFLKLKVAKQLCALCG